MAETNYCGKKLSFKEKLEEAGWSFDKDSATVRPDLSRCQYQVKLLTE